MGEENTKIRKLYFQDFDIDKYLKQYYSSIDEEESFFLEHLSKIKGDCLPKPRIVVEIGSGPLISGLVSASGWADLLVFSDLLESNRKRIKETLSNISSSPSDLSSIDLVADIEGISAKALITRLERCPKIIAESDIFFPGVLHPGLCLPQPPALVIMKLCLEFSITSTSDLAPALARVASIIAPGGLLVIMGALGESYYMIGDKRFPALCITKQTMRKAVEAEEDLEMIEWQEMARLTDTQSKPTGHSGVYCMLARKM